MNDFEKGLIERGYSEREVRKQISRARSFSRDSLLDREYIREEENKITLYLTYYPVAKNLKEILEELHLLSITGVSCKTVFKNVLVIGFKNERSLKDQFKWVVLPNLMQMFYPNSVCVWEAAEAGDGW